MSELANQREVQRGSELAARSAASVESQLFYAREEVVLKDRLIRGLRAQVRDLQAQVGLSSSEFSTPCEDIALPPFKGQRFSRKQGCSPGSKAIRRLMASD